MKGLNLLSVIIAGTGGVLLYSAVKGLDPRDVVRSALAGESPGALPQKYGVGTAGTSGMTATPPADSGDNQDDAPAPPYGHRGSDHAQPDV